MPGPGKVVSPRDFCPDTGLARLSCGQARVLLDEHPALGGESGTGWDLLSNEPGHFVLADRRALRPLPVSRTGRSPHRRPSAQPPLLPWQRILQERARSTSASHTSG
jgi:hypothetical protein